eukprot:2691159-Prymnesium_polylepis.1
MSHAGARGCVTSGRPRSHTAASAAPGCPRARLQRTGLLGAVGCFAQAVYMHILSSAVGVAREKVLGALATTGARRRRCRAAQAAGGGGGNS